MRNRENESGSLRSAPMARFIRRRGAAHRRGDVAVFEAEPVIRADRMGLAAKAEIIQRSIEPIAAAVAGEYSSRAVSTVRGRGEANDQEPGLGIAETRQRLGPIALALIPARRLLRHLLAPAHQARALPASDDSFLKLLNLHRFLASTKPRRKEAR